MKTHFLIPLVMLTCLMGQLFAAKTDLKSEIKQAKELWQEVKVFEAISAWKKVQKIDPLNQEAQSFLEKIGPILEGSDSFLNLLEDFIEQGLTVEAERSLRNWRVPVLSKEQQARLYYLKAKIALKKDKSDDALFFLQSAKKMVGEKSLLSRIQLELGLLQISRGRRIIGLRLIDEAKALSKDPDEIAHMEWAIIKNKLDEERLHPGKIKEFIVKYPKYKHISLVYLKLSEVSKEWAAKATQESLLALLNAWDHSNGMSIRDRISNQLLGDIQSLYDPEPLKWLIERINNSKEDWEVVVPLRVLLYHTNRRLSILLRGKEATTHALRAEKVLDELLKERPKDYRYEDWYKSKAVVCFTAGQLELIHGSDITAIQIFIRAAKDLKELAKKGDSQSIDILKRIAIIMKSRGRPDSAKHFLEDLSLTFLGEELGREAMWSLAELYKNRLDRPLKYVQTLKRYQDIYPPNFRIPSSAQDRIRKLGYRDVGSFQAAHGLTPDGIIGKETYSILHQEEKVFREIFPEEQEVEQTRGHMIHNAVFKTAETLREKSRFREAIQAYLEFNSMYPGYHLGDDAMIGIARIFKQCELFEEAIVVYERIIDDYPKGDKTRFAYIEVAECYMGLGKWTDAKDTYQQFIQNFPRYKQTPLAKRNRASLEKIIKYDEFLKEKPDASKSSNASYELAKIVYKELKDIRKAARLFSNIADTYTKSYHGPDAAYTSGVCFLHESDFENAREAFSKVVTKHKESRLADDAQYWIGHTYEYRARSLGKLDNKKIVLRSRSAKEVEHLRSDIKLRSLFWSEAEPLKPTDIKVKDSVEFAHIRDQVRSDLQKAIVAYRKVVSDFKRGDMAQKALLAVGNIYSQYLKDHDKAIEVYRELLHKYPGSHAAVDAQYEVGYHYLKKKNYDEAEKAIELFLTSFPNHRKVMDALLDLANCHRQQKKWIKALDDYQTYLNKFPKSKKSSFVKSEIDWIKKYRF